MISTNDLLLMWLLWKPCVVSTTGTALRDTTYRAMRPVQHAGRRHEATCMMQIRMASTAVN
jgi:hypothetical protein